MRMTASSKYNHASRGYHPAIETDGGVWIVPTIMFHEEEGALHYARTAIENWLAQQMREVGGFVKMEERDGK